MYKKSIIYFLIVILGFSCQTVEKPQKPASFMPKEKMLALLIDIAVVKSGKDFDLKTIKEKGITPSDFIYKKHGIDSTIYQENNAWYAANPKLYLELFTIVRDTLEVRKTRLQKQLVIQDSLKGLKDSLHVKRRGGKKSLVKRNLNQKGAIIKSMGQKVKKKAKK